MNPATPPVIEPTALPPPPRFQLPKAAWITWGIVAALRLGFALWTGAALDPYGLGQAIGQIVSLLVFPTVIAWVVWRLTGRKPRAGQLTFFIIFALLVLGQLAEFSRRAETTRMLSGLSEDARGLQSAGNTDPAKATDFLESTSNKLGAASAGAVGEERAYLEAVQALTAQLAAKTRDYGTASSKLGLDTFFDFTLLDTKEKITARRALLAEFRRISTDLRETQANGEALFRAELEQRRVSPTMIAQALAGYRSSSGAQLPFLLKMRDLETAYLGMMREFLDFAESQLGQWELHDSRLIFTDDAALERYNTLLDRFAENEKAQQALQQQLQQAAAAQ
jgi:hypothetical protein